MTFKRLWTMIRTTWQSRPFAILLPLGALAWYWWSHGHDVHSFKSFPNWQEFVAGAALLGTKFERLTEFFFGAPAPETLPPPVAPPGGGPKAASVVLLLGLGFALQSCAHVSAVIKDIDACVTTDGPQAIRDIESSAGPFIESVLMCDPTFSTAALPDCAAEALAGVAASVGPDGQRFVSCVVTSIENDPAAAAQVKARAHAARVKLAAGR